jgi:hypothetical protein
MLGSKIIILGTFLNKKINRGQNIKYRKVRVREIAECQTTYFHNQTKKAHEEKITVHISILNNHLPAYLTHGLGLQSRVLQKKALTE